MYLQQMVSVISGGISPQYTTNHHRCSYQRVGVDSSRRSVYARPATRTAMQAAAGRHRLATIDDSLHARKTNERPHSSSHSPLPPTITMAFKSRHELERLGLHELVQHAMPRVFVCRPWSDLLPLAANCRPLVLTRATALHAQQTQRHRRAVAALWPIAWRGVHSERDSVARAIGVHCGRDFLLGERFPAPRETSTTVFSQSS
jgi:hypothetical protein